MANRSFVSFFAARSLAALGGAAFASLSVGVACSDPGWLNADNGTGGVSGTGGYGWQADDDIAIDGSSLPPPPPVGDADADGLSDEHERLIGFNPYDADSDHDGCEDYFDVAFPQCQVGDLTYRPLDSCSFYELRIPLNQIVPRGRLVQIWFERVATADDMGGGPSVLEEQAYAPAFEVNQDFISVDVGTTPESCLCRTSPQNIRVLAGTLVVRDALTHQELSRARFFADKFHNDCLVP